MTTAEPPLDPLVKRLSRRFFWDTDPASVDPRIHQRWLGERVLSHGTWEDWKILRDYFGVAQLGEIVKQIRCLPPRAETFCCTVLGLRKESLRCYTERQSNPACSIWHNG